MERILTDSEVLFLNSQGITLDELYDARGQRLTLWQDHCRANNIFFVVGSRCKRSGHRLRTRANHCIQCDTQKIAFMRRHYRPANVYVAWSPSTKLTKIGVADDVRRRLLQLRAEAYGGPTDWTAKMAFSTEGAGQVELRVQSRLKAYAVFGDYQKDGHSQAAKELFDCDPDVAAAALLSEASSKQMLRFSWWGDKMIRRMVSAHCGEK